MVDASIAPWPASAATARSVSLRLCSPKTLQASSIDPSPKVRAAALKAAIKLSRDDDAQLRLIALGRWRSEV